MESLFANPIVEVAVLPFTVGLLCALALRGIHASTRVTGLVLGVAFCALYLMLEGLPPVVPVASKQKLAYLVPLAVVLGVGFVPLVKGLRWRGAIAAAFVLLCVVWLGWRKIAGKPTPELFLFLLAFWPIGTAILAGTSWLAGRSSSPGSDDAPTGGGAWPRGFDPGVETCPKRRFGSPPSGPRRDILLIGSGLAACPFQRSESLTPWSEPGSRLVTTEREIFRLVRPSWPRAPEDLCMVTSMLAK